MADPQAITKRRYWRSKRFTHFYVVRLPGGLTKIGITSDLPSRLDAWRVAGGDPICAFRVAKAGELESYVCREFAGFRTSSREIFAIDLARCAWLISLDQCEGLQAAFGPIRPVPVPQRSGAPRPRNPTGGSSQ